MLMYVLEQKIWFNQFILQIIKYSIVISTLFDLDDHMWFNIHTQAVSSDNNFSSFYKFYAINLYCNPFVDYTSKFTIQ